MKKHSQNPDGHVYYELYIILALLLVSLAVGFGQYRRYGLKGAALGTLLTLAAIILPFYLLAKLGDLLDVLNRSWRDRKGYPAVRKSLHILLLFCLFSFFGLIICAPLLFRFDLSEAALGWALNIAVPLAGILGTFARLRLRERFWPAFGRFCVFLTLSFLGAVLGMAIGIFLRWPLPLFLRAVDLGALIPLGIYFGFLFKRWIKGRNP